LLEPAQNICTAVVTAVTIAHAQAAMTLGGSIKTHYKSPLANCELKKLVC